MPKKYFHERYLASVLKEALEKKMVFIGGPGFPEPLFSNNENEHRIWQKERINKVVSEDLRGPENVKDINL